MSVLLAPAPAPRHTLSAQLEEIEWRDSGDPARKNETTLRGHAAVFGKLSEDLGGFREMLEPGAFRAALRKRPDVRLLLNHDPNFVLARTGSDTLELREDKAGLHVFARVDTSISWVSDLRVSMQRGDIDQMSFAFTVGEGGDEWAMAEDGTVVRTIRADGVDGLFDTSVVTFPAYPQTDAGMRSLLVQAVEQGHLPSSLLQDDAAGAGTDLGISGGDGSDSHSGSGEGRMRLVALRARSRAAVETYRKDTKQ